MDELQVYHCIIDFLDEHDVAYTIRVHAPTYTSEESAAIRGEDLSSGAKAIVYKIQDGFALFVLAADRKLDPRKIKAFYKERGLKAKKSRFASRDELHSLTGLQRGAVPPFGRPILDFDLYVDHSLLANETISFNAGNLERSVSMSLEEYMRIAGAVVFEFS